jgi:hypothetical protein
MAGITISDYDGNFEIVYDCDESGVGGCRFRLCEPHEPCIRNKYGFCTSEPAQAAALKRVKRKITQKLKTMIDI